MVLFNDQIIENSRVTSPVDKTNEPKLKILLTTLEYCEVFIEYSALKLGGERGRWIFIVIVQLIKWVFFLLILLKIRLKRDCRQFMSFMQ